MNSIDLAISAGDTTPHTHWVGSAIEIAVSRSWQDALFFAVAGALFGLVFCVIWTGGDAC